MTDQLTNIKKEYNRNSFRTVEDIYDLIAQGNTATAAHHYLFYLGKAQWKTHFFTLLDRITGDHTVSPTVQQNILEFLVLLTIGTQSFPARLKLHETIGPQETKDVYSRLLDVLQGCEQACREAAKLVNGKLCSAMKNQCIAEGLSAAEAEKEISILAGKSLSGFAVTTSRKIQASNFYNYTVANYGNPERTILGNDYADFLQYTLWLGYSFQTTNPPLIRMAWDMDRDYWLNQLASALTENSDSNMDISRICSLAALIVVEKSCRLLRDWFLFSQGKEGYVCFQVNPENVSDADKMIQEAKFVYEQLERRLGGVPNVSFKLPGTAAGLSAAEKLGTLGYSVTITLNFTAFQALAFGKVLKKSKAITSYIVVMNGRLAFPVRDELKQLHGDGDIPASQFAGIEVTRHIHRKFYSSEQDGGLGLDSGQVKLLNASLRIYGSDIPDISEIWGTSLITIFPNVRRAYDMFKRNDRTGSVYEETPESILAELAGSELFRQAWWVEGDPEHMKPGKVLSLLPDDNDAVLAWQPIQQTLAQFVDEYDNLRQIVKRVPTVIS